MEWIKFLLDVEKVYGKSLAYEFVVSVLDFIDTTGDYSMKKFQKEKEKSKREGFRKFDLKILGRRDLEFQIENKRVRI